MGAVVVGGGAVLRAAGGAAAFVRGAWVAGSGGGGVAAFAPSGVSDRLSSSGSRACSPLIRSAGDSAASASFWRWWAIMDATPTAPQSTIVATPRLVALASWTPRGDGRRCEVGAAGMTGMSIVAVVLSRSASGDSACFVIRSVTDTDPARTWRRPVVRRSTVSGPSVEYEM